MTTESANYSPRNRRLFQHNRPVADLPLALMNVGLGNSRRSPRSMSAESKNGAVSDAVLVHHLDCTPAAQRLMRAQADPACCLRRAHSSRVSAVCRAATICSSFGCRALQMNSSARFPSRAKMPLSVLACPAPGRYLDGGLCNVCRPGQYQACHRYR